MNSSALHSPGHPFLDVSGVTLQYKAQKHQVTAVHQVSFEVSRSERLVLLGPSGCGKSSLLKAIGGFLRPIEGQIRLNGSVITRPGPDRGMVFQEFDQLLPWKTVRENVAFALTVAGRFKSREANERAMDYIQKVKLTKFSESYPHTLSGGMKQRVAIARCMALNPEIILMDEPFAALDALTRQKMQEELLTLWGDSRFSMIFVTHSITEALTVGNRIILLSPHPGRIKADFSVDLESLGQERQGKFKELHEKIQHILFGDVYDYVI